MLHKILEVVNGTHSLSNKFRAIHPTVPTADKVLQPQRPHADAWLHRKLSEGLNPSDMPPKGSFVDSISSLVGNWSDVRMDDGGSSDHSPSKATSPLWSVAGKVTEARTAQYDWSRPEHRRQDAAGLPPF